MVTRRATGGGDETRTTTTASPGGAWQEVDATHVKTAATAWAPALQA
jgi:hypothetical protein